MFGAVLDIDGVASLAGYEWNIPEDEWIYVPPAGIVAFELMTSATGFTCAPKITTREC